MSLHDAAQHLAAQGRHGDSLLVHMNPKEVAGLQALAQHKGTSLSINPHTGLPEAFSLGDLNPFRIVQGKGSIGESGFGSMLIGAALMAAGMPPQMAGLVTGGATMAMGGNLRQSLGQGLGAYAGANMAGSMGVNAPQTPAPVTDAGTAVPPAPAAAPVSTPVTSTPSPGYFDNTMTAAENTVTPVQADRMVATATPTTPMGPLTDAQVDVGLGKPGTYTPVSEQGLMDKTGQFVKDYKWPLAGAGLLALTQEKPKGVEVEGQQQPGYIRPYIYDPKTQGLTQLRPVRAPGYADGGDVQPDPNMQQISTFDPVARMAHGGLSDLGVYSDGGRLLKGPGDGVSDSIPAVIGDKQPARLADGEFVVPARIVSELGNGSTEAGARKLYGMMDRIQKARGKTTGKNKVAANTRADKYLPA